MKREVAVKTLVGKGRQYIVKKTDIKVGENSSKSLGCWIINHHYQAYYQGKKLFVKGDYDIELWMAVDNDQKSEVYRTNVTFDEEVNSAFKDLVTLSDEMFLKTLVLHYPSCTGMELSQPGRVDITIESEYLIDVFAEALLVVVCADDNEVDMTLDEELVMNVNPDYLKISKKK